MQKTEPKQVLFETTLSVRVSDLNYGNHLCHTKLLSLIHEARVLWLSSLGYTEIDIDGIGLIVSEIKAKYKAEAFLGNQLRITATLGERKRSAFELCYSVYDVDREVLVAEVDMRFACMDYTTRKIAKIPEALGGLFLSHSAA